MIVSPRSSIEARALGVKGSSGGFDMSLAPRADGTRAWEVRSVLAIILEASVSTMRSRRWRSRSTLYAAWKSTRPPASCRLPYEGKTYWFCSKGCMLEFRDDPEKYLAPDYKPSM